MLISEKSDMDKADNKNAKMTGVDMNNVDAIREKTNSLNAQKIKNINNLMEAQSSQEKKIKFVNSEMKQHFSILFIILFVLTFIASVGVFSCITFTDWFNESIVDNLVLKNNTKTMEWWKDSPIQPLLKIHVFNYTNIDEYLSGKDKKLKVVDVGPFVYKEFGQRVKLQFHEDHKITFHENKTLVYMPELSEGYSENDLVRVPNIPLLAAITKSKIGLSAMEDTGLKLALQFSTPKEFHAKSVKEFLFGYSDGFTEKIFLAPERAGLLSSRKGVSTDNMTMHTAEDSLENLGRIYAMNGKTKLDIWNSDECNEIRGTDGSQFPVSLMDRTKQLKIFIKSFCRTLKLQYDREVIVLQKGIPAWRYKTPEGEFASSLKNPDNTCYCDADDKNKTCPPDGVFDASKCLDGVPLLLSYPHFMEGDSSLFEHFEGIKPDRSLHETYADIHPRMAFPIGGASRLQMNFKVSSMQFWAFFNNYEFYTKFPKDLILPVFWFEVTAGEIPAEFQSVVFHTTQSANATYLTIQYGSLIGAIVSLLLVLSTSYYYIVQITKKQNKKIDNCDVIVTYAPNVYPQLGSQTHQNTNQ